MPINFDNKRVLVFGDVMLDEYIEGSVERISPEAPVPVVDREHVWVSPGGAANVACNLASLGVDTTLVGVTGVDRTRDELVGTLRVPNLAVHLVYDAKRDTMRKTRVVAQNGQNLLRIDHGSLEPVSEAVADTLVALFRSLTELNDFDAIIVSDYAKGAVTANILHELILTRIPIYVDPKRRDFRFYFGVTMVKPNLKELRAATDIWDIEEGCHVAQSLTGADVLVTLGERGMEWHGRGHEPPVCAAAISHQVADVSGAGDTVMAAFVAATIAGWSPAECIRLANAAASVVVQKRGTACVTLREIAQVLQP